MNILYNSMSEKKDIVKANNSTNVFKDYIGNSLKMTGLLMYEKDEVDEKSGEVITQIVSCIRIEDGEFISTISPTVKNSLSAISSAYDKEEISAGLDIIVKSKKSNGGRDFIYIDLV